MTENVLQSESLISLLFVEPVCFILHAALNGMSRMRKWWLRFWIYAKLAVSLYWHNNPEDTENLHLMVHLLDTWCQRYSKYEFLRFNMFFRPSVLIFKPQAAEVVLSSQTLINKASEYRLLEPWMGTGLITSSGSKWRSRRKLLNPSFYLRVLENFIPVFQQNARVLVQRIHDLMDDPWMDAMTLACDCSLDIICQTAMGVRIASQEEYSKYNKAVHMLAHTFMYRLMRPWLHSDFIFNLTSRGREHKKKLKIVQDFTRKVIQEKKTLMMASQEGDEDRKKAFLEVLLELHLKDPSSISEEDIREEVDTLMAAGYETTGVSMGWTLYLIGLDPKVQQRIHEELDDIFGDDLDRDVQKEDLPLMKYLECVIKETLRLYPTVPIFGRQVDESFLINNYAVPKGSFCIIYLHKLHRDPDSFPDPETFDPERFFPENCIGRHPYAYVPFSAGPRNCIGQKFAFYEHKVVLASVLRKYKVTSLDPRDTIRLKPVIVNGFLGSVRMRFQLR